MKKIDYISIINKKNKIIGQYKKELFTLKKELEYYKKEVYTDSLTKLNNRRSIENIHDFDSLIFGDIDHFKVINDTYGHDLGDKILVEIGKILKKNVRHTDLVCRWGGEEFVIFLKNCSEEAAYNKAVILKNKIEKLEKKYGFKITMSFGISSLSDKTMKLALRQADDAMYESKKHGRNMVTIYSQNLY